jgi:hypothetical protein
MGHPSLSSDLCSPKKTLQKLSPTDEVIQIHLECVRGTRVTMTIPEGVEGNDRPITTVNETWRSPELNILLLSVREDPRTGTRTTEVTDLDRGEPDASVFQVPEGYTVKEPNPGQAK